MYNTKELTNLVSKVRSLRDNVILWRLLPEPITDAATDAIEAVHYFDYDLTPAQLEHVVDDLTNVINFIKKAVADL